ncbi:MAG: sigma-70 family RNA polymerase sigma factor [Polyangiaceae bacterium]|nr:sigma-70 family RNA polymerase sigma factor [Polyangiaceae bacterium]
MDVVDELVRRSRAGDRAAFTQLYREHRQSVARLVFRMTGRSNEVEDTVQEVFLQAYRSLGEFRGQSKFSTWLHRVAVNVVLMARRAQRNRPSVIDLPLESERSPDPRLLPDEDASRLRRMAAFRNLLEKIPEKKRVVYILHDIEGLPPTEIAAIVDAPVLTVRTRLFYARRELIKLMRRDPVLAQLVDEIAADLRQTEEPLAAAGEEES